MNSERPFTPLLALAWTFTFVFAMQVLGAVLVRARPSVATDIVSMAAVLAAVGLLVSAAILYLHGKDVPLTASLGLRPTHVAIPLLALLLGFTVHFPAEAVDIARQRFFPTPAEELQRELALLTAESFLGKAMILFFVACVGPLVEEILFRGVLFGVLRRHRSLVSTTLTIAGCFVAAHLEIGKWPALAIVALAMTYVRAASGSLLPSIGMHVVFNATTVLSVSLGQVVDPANRTLEVLPTVVFSAITVLLIVAIRYVAGRAPAARRGRAEDAE